MPDAEKASEATLMIRSFNSDRDVKCLVCSPISLLNTFFWTLGYLYLKRGQI